MTIIKRTKARRAPAGLNGWLPLSSLWDSAAPLYNSEQSARWAIKTHRRALIEAGAIGKHTGRIIVRPERFAQVAEQEALQAARRSLEKLQTR